MKTPNDYFSSLGVEFEKFDCTSTATAPILHFLIGKPWDSFALGWLHAVNPTYIRVTNGEIKTDTRIGRVTIVVDNYNIIQTINQEVEVGIPIPKLVNNGYIVNNGHDMKIMAEFSEL